MKSYLIILMMTCILISCVPQTDKDSCEDRKQSDIAVLCEFFPAVLKGKETMPNVDNKVVPPTQDQWNAVISSCASVKLEKKKCDNKQDFIYTNLLW